MAESASLVDNKENVLVAELRVTKVGNDWVIISNAENVKGAQVPCDSVQEGKV